MTDLEKAKIPEEKKSAEVVIKSEETIMGECILNLLLLSMIGKSEDIHIGKTKNYIFPCNIWNNNFIYTYITEENKEKTYNFIKENVQNGIDFYQKYSKINHKPKTSELGISLLKCGVGLQNLKNTYRDDKLFCIKIQSVIDSIFMK
jgi:hypothetical protein